MIFLVFKFLDRFIKIIILALTVSTLIALLVALTKNSNSFNFSQVFPFKTSIIFLAALIGWMPAPLDISVWQSLWILEKKKTNSIYGVDGSPVVKDIFHNGAWKTVAVFGMGEGEHSYSALDITNIDAPKHMWTFKNDPSTQTVTYWNSVGTKIEEAYSSVTAARDYSK